MYSICTKLNLIEEVLFGKADEVVDYLQTNFLNPVQQIHCMFSERAEQLKENFLQEITNNSSSFRILDETDSPFDSMCNYIGLVLYSYNKKSEFILNRQQYKRGDILIKDVNTVPNSSILWKSGFKNQQIYKTLFESLFNWYFKKVSDKRFIGLGIICEENKWKFDSFIFGSESIQSPFSLDEQRLLEMYVLTWTKNINDQPSIRDNARKMLNEQLDYVKDLLETQRPDMESTWTSKEIDLAIKAFENEIQDEISVLFQTTSIFNTFTNLRDQLQLKNENKLQLIVEIFEHRQLTLKTQPSEPLLCQIWQQLKMVENWLHINDFDSLINFLHFNTFTSIESIFSISIPPFLDQLSICPESDSFDPTLNYIGLLIYLYNDQDEFTLNKHQCKCGQILIRQKENITGFNQAPWYRKTSFAPLFIHEYLYEQYFNEKPNEFFQGIGFVYEQNKWKFDVITYTGIHGIHSTYDIRGDNLMKSSINEQHCLDLILSTIYINNKWRAELEYMYMIDELELFGRNSFRKEIEIIEELFQMKKTNLIKIDNNCYSDFKNFIEQYKPKLNQKPIMVKNNKSTKFLSSRNSRRSIDNQNDLPILINSESTGNSKKTAQFHPSVDNPSINFSQVQTSSNSQNFSTSFESKKSRTPSKPKAYSSFQNPFLKKRSTSCDASTSSQSAVKPTNPINHSDDLLSNDNRLHKRDSGSSKNKEPISLYQLWGELYDAEQKILHHSELTEFIKYLIKKDYMNDNKPNRFVPPDNEIEEYHLLAKTKIDAQLNFIKELFQLKKSKLLQEQSNQDRKQIEDLFKTFERHYTKQIDIAKKHLK